jgi:hypothetical protein
VTIGMLIASAVLLAAFAAIESRAGARCRRRA